MNPPPLFACHCSDGVGEPLAEAVNDTNPPTQTPVLDGFVVATGAVLTVNVATLDVALPPTLEKIARN